MDVEAIRASLGYRPLECQICAGVAFAGPRAADAHFAAAHPSLAQPQLRPCLDLDLEDDVERLLAKAKASSPAKSLLSSASLADAPPPLEPRGAPQRSPGPVQPEGNEEEAEELDGPIDGMEEPDEESSASSSLDDAFCSFPDDSPAKSPAQGPQSHSPAVSPQPPACVCRQCALCRLAETEAGVAAHLREHHKVAPSSDLSPLILRRPADDCDCRLSFPDASHEEEEEPSFVHASLADLPTSPARPSPTPASASTDGSQSQPPSRLAGKPQSCTCRLCGELVTTDSSFPSVLRQHQAYHVYKAHMQMPVMSCDQCGRSWEVPRRDNALKHARTHVDTDAEARKLICDETSKHLQRFTSLRRQCFDQDSFSDLPMTPAWPSESVLSAVLAPSADEGQSRPVAEAQSCACRLCGERLATGSASPEALHHHQASHVYKAHLKLPLLSCYRCGRSWDVPRMGNVLRHAKTHVKNIAEAKKLICDETAKHQESYRNLHRQCFEQRLPLDSNEEEVASLDEASPVVAPMTLAWPSEIRLESESVDGPSEASVDQTPASMTRKLRSTTCQLCGERLSVTGTCNSLWTLKAAHVHKAHLRKVLLSCYRCGRSWHQPRLQTALAHARTHAKTAAEARALVRDETAKHRRRYQTLYKDCFAQ